MTTPALGQYGLSGVSDIVVSFKACPYTEPNLTTGNLMVSPYILCGATFNISIWAGAGTFENGSTEMTLTNLTPDQTDAQGNGHYSWTEHSVRIKGADSHTRVSISTVAQKGYYRMWFDDLMIVRDDGGQSEGSSGSGSGGDYGDGGTDSIRRVPPPRAVRPEGDPMATAATGLIRAALRAARLRAAITATEATVSENKIKV